jgi:hypothetical protein
VDWVPEGQTVNQVYYKEVLTNLRERVRRKIPEMWKNVTGRDLCEGPIPLPQESY